MDESRRVQWRSKVLQSLLAEASGERDRPIKIKLRGYQRAPLATVLRAVNVRCLPRRS
jgi:hypothetical protein